MFSITKGSGPFNELQSAGVQCIECFVAAMASRAVAAVDCVDGRGRTVLETQTTRGRAASYAVRILSPWRSYNFRWYWTGSATQALSQGAQMLVLSWLVLEVSGSSTQVGLVLFLYGLPNVGLLMVGGVIADRVDRKRLLITIQLAVGASISALAALSLADVIAVWHVYVAAALLGSLRRAMTSWPGR